MTALSVVPTGLFEYQESWDLQTALARARRRGLIDDTLLLVEHPPTYTIGRSGSRANLLIDDHTLERVGASCYEIDRGGDITFHGPGQLVGYLISDLGREHRSLRRFVSRLEQTIIRTLREISITCHVATGRPGVWVRDKKIAAIGVAVSRGVTYHGFALNVDPDLRYFSYMIPCGIADTGVTSLARLTGQPVSMNEVDDLLVRHISAAFDAEPVFDLSLDDLRAVVTNHLSDHPA